MQIGGTFQATLMTTVFSTSFVEVLDWAGSSETLKFGLVHSNTTGISVSPCMELESLGGRGAIIGCIGGTV